MKSIHKTNKKELGYYKKHTLYIYIFHTIIEMPTLSEARTPSIKDKNTKFKTSSDLMSWLCNMYADGDYCCDNEDFKEALRNHVRWVKVMNCGTSGTETLDDHYMLQVYLDKIGSVNKFNRK